MSRNVLYKDPLPVTLSQPLIPHNPLSLLTLVYQYCFASNPEPKIIGYYCAESQSVTVRRREWIDLLWRQGFFGKGTLSRSEATWVVRQQRALGIIGPEEGLTSEEITAKRRAERKAFKRERAQNEREALRRTLIEEGKEQPLQQHEEILKTEVKTTTMAILDGEEENLQLTTAEAFFLAFGLGSLDVIDSSGCIIELRHLLKAFCLGQNVDITPDNPFLVNYVVYHYFRSLGWVVKSGIKFAVDYCKFEQFHSKSGPLLT